MGNIQDLEILSARMMKWAGKKEKRVHQMKPVLEELFRQKEKRVDTFLDSAHKVRTFWKHT